MASRRILENSATKIALEPKSEWSPSIEILNNDAYVLVFRADLSEVPQAPSSTDVQIKGRTVTFRGHRNDPEGSGKNSRRVEGLDSNGVASVKVQFPQQYFERQFILPDSVDVGRAVAAYDPGRCSLTVRFPKANEAPTDLATDEEARLRLFRQAVSVAKGQSVQETSPPVPFPIDFVLDHPPNPYGQKPMEGIRMVADKGAITKEGVRYVPLTYATWASQVPRSTLIDWIKKRAKFGGQTIKTHVSAITEELYISEQSILKMTERFVKWPSMEPAGPITLGETDDRSGFLGLPDAAKLVGVASRTMWVWASQGKTATGKVLDVVKCTASDHFYVRHNDITELAALMQATVPRGRRSRLGIPVKTPRPV